MQAAFTRFEQYGATSIHDPFYLVGIGCTGCFRRWVMTDKEVRKYYANKPVKPTWFTIQNDSATLYCATTGSDTLPPLLMIHGAPGAWYGSRILLDDSILQKHFHLIAVDRPGYHKSRFKGKKRLLPPSPRKRKSSMRRCASTVRTNRA